MAPTLRSALCLLSALALAAACDHHAHHVHDHVHDHAHGHVAAEMRALEAEASSKATTTEYVCPVCGMSSMYADYANENYVALEHGQRVYTCGMAARAFGDYSFSSTDTAYLAANVAEFVVNATAADDYAECEDSCTECADGLYDPVDGTQVTTSNYHYVCLSKGQKIYFASLANKNTYLSKVNQDVRYLVEDVVCAGSTCSDATQITTLSAAAAAMEPDLASSSGSSDTTTAPSTSSEDGTASSTTTTTTEEDTSSGFCSGEGSVMFNGFQSTINGSCVKLLFQPWVLNSAVKYAFGFIGCFLVALFNEYLARARETVRQRLLMARKQRPLDKLHRMQCKALLAGLYMVQMAIAYFAMLVVMTYETGLFIALLLGFGAGFLLFKNFDRDVTDERGVWRFTDPSTAALRVGGMSCMANCGNTVEKALNAVPGVTNAFVAFDERTAYAAGTAQYGELVEAIEAVGFTVDTEASASRQGSSCA